MATASPSAQRRAGIRTRYRRRLRSRIILGFVLLGFSLTAMFAVATLWLRDRLESQLVERTLEREVRNLVDQVETNPDLPPYFLIFDVVKQR